MKKLYARLVLWLIRPALIYRDTRAVDTVAENSGIALMAGGDLGELMQALGDRIQTRPLGADVTKS